MEEILSKIIPMYLGLFVGIIFIFVSTKINARVMSLSVVVISWLICAFAFDPMIRSMTYFGGIMRIINWVYLPIILPLAHLQYRRKLEI